MLYLLVGLQAAAVFSVCAAWRGTEYTPNRNFIVVSTRRTARTAQTARTPPHHTTLELVENFTEFLQKKQKNAKKKLEEQARARNPYIVNVWAKKTEDFTTTTTTTTEKTADKIYDLEVDSKLFKAADVLYKFSTKRTNPPISRTIFIGKTEKFKIDDEHEANDPIYKILEDKQKSLQNLRRFGSFDAVTGLFKDITTEIKPEIELAKIFNKESMTTTEDNVLKSIHSLTNITSGTTKKEFNLDELIKKEKDKIVTTSAKPVVAVVKKVELKVPKIQAQIKKSGVGGRKIELNKYAQLKQMVEKNMKLTNKSDLLKQVPTKAKIIPKPTANEEHRVKYEKILNRENQILDILKRQTSLLEQVAKLLDAKEGKEIIRTQTDFETLIEELDKKRNKLDRNMNLTQNAVNTVQEKLRNMYKNSTNGQNKGQTTITTKIAMLPTVRTVIDESEVRKALKNDPYVQRILKMAKRKRTEYLKAARNQT